MIGWAPSLPTDILVYMIQLIPSYHEALPVLLTCKSVYSRMKRYIRHVNLDDREVIDPEFLANCELESISVNGGTSGYILGLLRNEFYPNLKSFCVSRMCLDVERSEGERYFNPASCCDLMLLKELKMINCVSCDWAFLEECENLELLDLSGSTVSGSHIRYLYGLRALKHLNLSNIHDVYTHDLMSLVDLDLTYLNLDDMPNISQKGGVYSIFGRNRFSRTKFKESLFFFEKAHLSSPENSGFIINLSRCLLYLNRSKDCLELLKSENSDDAALSRETAYRNLGLFTKSMEELDFVLQRDPTNSRALYRKAANLIKLTEYDLSEKCLLLADSNRKGNPHIFLTDGYSSDNSTYHLYTKDCILFLLGDIYHERSDFYLAAKYYHKAIVFNPAHPAAPSNFKFENIESARRLYNYILSQNELDESVAYTLGLIYMSLGLNDSAMIYFKKSIEVSNVTFSAPYHRIGQIYDQSESYDNAILNYELAIESNQHRWSSWECIFNILFKQNRVVELESYFQKGRKIFQDPAMLEKLNNLDQLYHIERI